MTDSSVVDELAVTLAGLRPDDCAAAAVGPWAEVPDARLVASVAAVAGSPPRGPRDSFDLHAPLEVAARAGLLTHVVPAARSSLRARLLWVAATAAGRESEIVVAPPRLDSVEEPADAVRRLARSVAEGDADTADAAAAWLVRHLDPVSVGVAVAPLVLPSLAAAGHGSILLHLGGRVAPRTPEIMWGLRVVARDMADHPDWSIGWIRRRAALATGMPNGDGATGGLEGAAQLAEVLRRPPSPGRPVVSFIHPLVEMVERDGFAAGQLDGVTRGVTVAAATRALLRTAALSMVSDDEEAAPYGWSHCFTLPQAALSIVGPGVPASDAVAVAATYVLAFRAIEGKVDLDDGWRPDPAGGPAKPDRAALRASPHEAAAAAWHWPFDQRPRLIAELAAWAGGHPDAHLAKYTLACLDAAAGDPHSSRLYLAAAAYLGAWWRGRTDGADEILNI